MYINLNTNFHLHAFIPRRFLENKRLLPCIIIMNRIISCILVFNEILIFTFSSFQRRGGGGSL